MYKSHPIPRCNNRSRRSDKIAIHNESAQHNDDYIALNKNSMSNFITDITVNCKYYIVCKVQTNSSTMSNGITYQRKKHERQMQTDKITNNFTRRCITNTVATSRSSPTIGRKLKKINQQLTIGRLARGRQQKRGSAL